MAVDVLPALVWADACGLARKLLGRHCRPMIALPMRRRRRCKRMLPVHTLLHLLVTLHLATSAGSWNAGAATE